MNPDQVLDKAPESTKTVNVQRNKLGYKTIPTIKFYKKNWALCEQVIKW